MKRAVANHILWAAFLSFGLAVSVVSADVQTGLVAYYPLEEGEGSVAHNMAPGAAGTDGNFNGGYEWIEGKVGNFSVKFDGQWGTSVDCGTWNPSEATGQLTVAVWMRWEGFNDQWQGVVAKRDGWDENSTYWNIEIDRDTSNLGFFQYDSYPAFGTGTNVPPERVWQHVAVTFDGTTVTMYLDSVLIGSSTAFSFGPKADAHLVFGAVETGANPFNGTLDEVRIYDRALSADDIVELYTWTGLATAGPDQEVTTGDRVTLTGTGPDDAAFTWEQIGGLDDFVATLEPSANQATVEFDTPVRDIGFLLTFLLTIASPTKGTASDEVDIYVYAPNLPKLAPSNFRLMPLDLGVDGLGFRLEWDLILDATQYQIGLKIAENQYVWLDTIQRTTYERAGMLEGDTRTIAVRGENRFSVLGSSDPADHGAQSEDVIYKAMPNLARPEGLGGTIPPLGPVEGVTYKISHFSIAGLNDGNYEDSNDSWDGFYKEEDFWGYLWSEPVFLNHIVYFTGNVLGNGGWFTDLRVQYTEDGSTWNDVPIVRVFPEYDFTDDPAGRKPSTRHDIVIPTVRGTGIRIYGTPGGTAYFTSIAELEVFGSQALAPLVVQGIDTEVPEGSTAILDGTFTFSMVGPITSYQWTGPVGVTINNDTSPIASFDAPNVGQDELFVFTLEASDGTNSGTDDDVRILVKNLKTTAVAGLDQSVEEGSEVTLDGSGSLTTSGDITYLWTQKAGKDAGVTGATTATVTFAAPIIWGYNEQLTFELQVNDGLGAPDSVSTDEVVVEIRNSLSWPVYPLGAGYFQDLLHLGHNPTDRLDDPHSWGNITSGFDPLETFGGEANIMPYPGLEYDFTDTGVTVTRNPMRWAPIHSRDGFFGTEEVLDEFQQIYHIYILSPDDRDVTWRSHNDDEMRVWNNGVLVLSRDTNSWDSAEGEAEDGYAADGTGLKKGLNSIAMKFEEGTEGNRMAVRVTDQFGEDFTDLMYSLGPSLILSDAYATRTLPGSYQPGVLIDVSLAVKVNPDNKPGSVDIVEQIPGGLTESEVNAPGADVAGGAITWRLSGEDVKNTTLSYSLTIPQGTSQTLDFEGTLTFGAETAYIFGQDTIYSVPSAPRGLEVEMFGAARLTWSPPLTEDIRDYTVYRSVDGGSWEEIATTSATTYFDGSVVPGEHYSYQVSATSIPGVEGPTSRPTAQATPLTQAEVEQGRVIREAENFNYGQGQYPGYEDCPAGNESPAADNLDAQYDYFHPNEGGPDPAVYRTNDGIPDGIGVETVLDDGTTDVWHTNIGWIDAGAWWRYTFNVTEPGWVDIALRVAAPGSAVLAAYWDEVLIGRSVPFTTGSNHTLTYVRLEDRIETTTGEHVLRVEAVTSGWNFDNIAIAFNAGPPRRAAIWGDDFDSYTANSEVFDAAVGGWTKQTAGYPDGAWQLWNTAVEPDIAGMKDGFMMSNSDMSGEDAPLDEQFISQQIDTADWTKLRLNFNWNYQNYLVDPDDPQIAEVDLRVKDNDPDPWGDWINLLHLDLDSVPTDLDPAILSGTDVHDLSVYDGKILQIRFHYYDAEWDYWFAVDTIRVSGIQPEILAGIMGLSLVGDQLTLDWEPHGSYYIEHTTDLTGTWADLPGVPVTGTTAVVTIPAGAEGYYRVRSE